MVLRGGASPVYRVVLTEAMEKDDGDEDEEEDDVWIWARQILAVT
jgi:hypothetical protein